MEELKKEHESQIKKLNKKIDKLKKKQDEDNQKFLNDIKKQNKVANELENDYKNKIDKINLKLSSLREDLNASKQESEKYQKKCKNQKVTYDFEIVRLNEEAKELEKQNMAQTETLNSYELAPKTLNVLFKTVNEKIKELNLLRIDLGNLKNMKLREILCNIEPVKMNTQRRLLI